MRIPRIAVAVSGAGRSLRNLLERQEDYRIAAVISSSGKAGANQIAEEAGLPLFIGDFKQDLAEALNRWLVEQSIDWIALAGFLKPFPSLSAFAGHIVNIHPALLPRYGGKGMYGMNVHRAVFAAGDEHAGASVHFVNEVYDEGQIIAQARVPTAGAGSPEGLAQRVFDAECELYPRVLQGLCRGNLPLREGRVWMLGET